MTFQNQKKSFLEKEDYSKKGSIDEKAKDIIKTINKLENYYTTSSCSGRVMFIRGEEKKNQKEWLKVSHDTILEDFFELEDTSGFIWLKLEPFILHVACKSIEDANTLLNTAQKIFKKSSILSIQNKIIVEIQGSEHADIPYYRDNTKIFINDENWLLNYINSKLKQNWKKIEKCRLMIDSFSNT